MNSAPILKGVKNNNYGLKPGYYSTIYEGIIVAIVQQQISLKIASRMVSLIVRKYGDRVKIVDREFWELRACENVNPAGDLGARKAISHFYNDDKLMSEAEVREFTEPWEKYKGCITYYLIAGYLFIR